MCMSIFMYINSIHITVKKVKMFSDESPYHTCVSTRDKPTRRGEWNATKRVSGNIGIIAGLPIIKIWFDSILKPSLKNFQ